MFGVVLSIKAEVHHECGAGESALSNSRWLVTRETFLLEECANGSAKVGVDHDVVAVHFFATRQFDTARSAPIQQYASHRGGRVYLSSFFAGDLGEGLADSAKPSHDVIHTVRMFRVRDHGE